MTDIDFSSLPNNTAAKWWRDPGMRMGMLHIIALYTAVYSLGYDGSLLNGLQALPTWQKQFDHPTGTDLGLLAASYYMPKIPASFIIAWLVDRFGRKIPLYLGSIFMLAGALLGGFCHTKAELIGARILLGIGTALAQITAAALVPELAHPRLRHFAAGFLNTVYFVGSIFAAWLCFAMVYYPHPESSWAWRVPTLVQGLGPIVLCTFVFFVPESPRWLIKKGRVDDAHKILAKYHANGDMEDPLVQFELEEIKHHLQQEELEGQSTWLSFFRTRGNLRRFFVIIMVGTATQWLGSGIVSYFLIPILKQVGITKAAETAGINGGLSIWSWIVAMIGALLSNRSGRRGLFLVSLVGCLASFIFVAGLSGSYATHKSDSVGLAVVPFLFMFNAFYALAFTPIPMLYVPEISPYALRAKSASLLLLAQNCAQSFNQFANPVALAAIGWKYFTVYIAVIATYIVLFFFFLRETKSLTVEEAAVVYDSDDMKRQWLLYELRRQPQPVHQMEGRKESELVEVP